MTNEQMRDLVKECGLDWHRGYMPLFEGDDTNRYAVLIAEAMRIEREACAKEEEGLHVAICQAVATMNISPEIARNSSLREAHNILRQALANYHMDQPASEKERNVIASRHRKAIRARGNKGESG